MFNSKQSAYKVQSFAEIGNSRLQKRHEWLNPNVDFLVNDTNKMSEFMLTNEVNGSLEINTTPTYYETLQFPTYANSRTLTKPQRISLAKHMKIIDKKVNPESECSEQDFYYFLSISLIFMFYERSGAHQITINYYHLREFHSVSRKCLGENQRNLH